MNQPRTTPMLAWLTACLVGATPGLCDDNRPAKFAALLDDPSVEARLLAIRMLDADRDPARTDALAQCLKDPSWEIRVAAAGVLARRGDKRAMPILLEALTLHSQTLNHNAAQALGSLGDERAVGPLLALMDREKFPGPAIMKSLGQIGGAQAVATLLKFAGDTDFAYRHDAIEALGLAGDRSVVPFLIDLVERKDKHTQYASAALAEFGPPILPTLIALLKNAPAEQYGRLLPVISRIGGREAIVALVGSLPVIDCRQLIEQHGKAAVPVLAGSLKIDNDKLGRRAAAILGNIGDPAAVDALIELVKSDRRADVRGYAAQALGRIGDKRAIPAIRAAFADYLEWRKSSGDADIDERNQHSVLRDFSAEALGLLGDRESIDLLMRYPDWFTGSVCQALGRLKAEQAVEKVLEYTRTHVRSGPHVQVEALGAIGDKRAVPWLIEQLKSKDDVWRISIIMSLGEIGDPRAVDALLPLLKYETRNWDVARAAATSLGMIGDARALPGLIACLDSKNHWLRARAIVALGQIGDKRAVPHLLPIYAQEALLAIGDRSIIPGAIKKLSSDDARTRAGNVRLLGAMKAGEAVAPLCRAASDSDSTVRRDVAEALGRIGDPKAVPVLEVLVEDKASGVGPAAVEALRRLDTPSARAVLQRALHSRSVYVRRKATEALEALENPTRE